jgi:hypothetical protein
LNAEEKLATKRTLPLSTLIRQSVDRSAVGHNAKNSH